MIALSVVATWPGWSSSRSVSHYSATYLSSIKTGEALTNVKGQGLGDSLMDVGVEDDWSKANPGLYPVRSFFLSSRTPSNSTIAQITCTTAIILAAWHSDLRHPGHKA